jgi:putative membrane protein
MSIESQFGAEAQRRISEAVARAERASRGQIVPVVVAKSDHYGEVPWRGGFIAVAIVTAVALLLPDRWAFAHLPGAGLLERLLPDALTAARLVAFQLVAGLLGAAVSRWDPLERLLAGRRTQAASVHVRALLAFEQQGLARTKEGTGVLLFASLFERRAVVIGDHGIHAVMKDGAWEQTVAALTAGMKADDPARGFEDAIILCGAKLAEHFPRAAGEAAASNELADGIRVERE